MFSGSEPQATLREGRGLVDDHAVDGAPRVVVGVHGHLAGLVLHVAVFQLDAGPVQDCQT